MNFKFTSILALAGTAVAAQSAIAADLPRMPTKAPVVAVAPTWAGCYVGLHAGGGWASNTWTNTANTTFFGDLSPGQGFSQTASGFIGGGQIGCNFQAGALVYGIEGTLSFGSIRDGLRNTTFGAGLDDEFTHRIRTIGTIAGRLGYAAGLWMPYIKAGYAGANVGLSVVDNLPVSTGAGSDSKWHHGLVAGVGLEYMLTRNWIIGAEYNHIWLQTKSYELRGTSTGFYTFDMRPRLHTAVGRLSYKW